MTIGLFSSVLPRFKNEDIRIKNNENSTTLNPNSYFLFPFGVLFIFWLLFYFGRTTWGGLINLIPSMEEFHLSRFIVGLHITGLFLIPIGIDKFLPSFYARIPKSISTKHLLTLYSLLFTLLLIFTVSPKRSAIAPTTTRLSNKPIQTLKKLNQTFPSYYLLLTIYS